MEWKKIGRAELNFYEISLLSMSTWAPSAIEHDAVNIMNAFLIFNYVHPNKLVFKSEKKRVKVWNLHNRMSISQLGCRRFLKNFLICSTILNLPMVIDKFPLTLVTRSHWELVNNKGSQKSPVINWLSVVSCYQSRREFVHTCQLLSLAEKLLKEVFVEWSKT